MSALRPAPKSRLVLYPFLFGVWPILAFYAQNTTDVSIIAPLRPMIVVSAGVLLAWGLVWLWTRDAARSGLVVTLPTLAFFGIWRLLRPQLEVLGESSGIGLRYLVLVFGLLVFATMAVIVLRQVACAPLTRPLNMVSGMLVALAVGQAILSGGMFWQAAEPARAAMAPTTEPSDALPDVYFIILDAYARADVLRDTFGFDNTQFLEHMQARGFALAAESLVSYDATIKSLPACLNMSHLATLREAAGLDDIGSDHLRAWYHDSRVYRIFKDMGYTIYGVPTGYTFTEPGPLTDVVLETAAGFWEPTRFELTLLEFTPIARALRYAGVDPGQTSWRRRVLENLENLSVPAGREEGPVFVHAHIVAPHPPFVLRADGGPTAPSGRFTLVPVVSPGASYAEYKRHYVAQVQGVNGYVEQVIDTILAQSDRPAVIALVSDHGPKVDPATPEDVKKNLCLVRLPESGQDAVPSDLNLVNLFPIIFREAFAIEVPLVSDPAPVPRAVAAATLPEESTAR